MNMATRLEWHGEDFLRHLKRDVLMVRLETASLIVAERMRDLIAGPKHGKRYWNKRLRDTYQASAPGEPPASPTGKLLESIGNWVLEEHGRIVGRAGSTMRGISAALERGSAKVLPRPYQRRALEESRDRAIRALQGRL